MFFTVKYSIQNKIKKYQNEIDKLIEERAEYQLIYDAGVSFHDLLEESSNKSKITSLLSIHPDPRSESILSELKELGEIELISILEDLPLYQGKEITHKNNLMLQTFKDILFSQSARPIINTPHQQKREKPLNVAFAGGGGKGFAHIGSIRRILEEPNVKIESVAGTSAGAIAALPLALGYNPDQLEKMVLDTDFSMFIYESNMNSKLGLMFGHKQKLLLQTLFLDSVKKELEEKFYPFVYNNPILKNMLEIKINDTINHTEEKKFNYMKDLFRSPYFLNSKRRGNLIKYMFTEPRHELRSIVKNAQKNARKNLEESKEFIALNPRSPSSLDYKYNDAQNEILKYFSQVPDKELMTFLRLQRKEDLIEEYFGDLIYQTLKKLDKSILQEVFEKEEVPEQRLRDLTFKEFQEIRRILDKRGVKHNLKDLCICICEIKDTSITKLFKKDNYVQVDAHAGSDDPIVANMPIKTAVRISMNLPGVFKSYQYADKNWGDGGVRANFPLHYFKKQKKPDSQSIGFSLAQESAYLKADRVNNIGKTFQTESDSNYTLGRMLDKGIGVFSKFLEMNHARKLDNLSDYNELDLMRIAITNVNKAGTLDFNMGTNEKISLMEAGYKSANDLFSPYYHAQLSFYNNKMSSLLGRISDEVKLATQKDKEFGQNLIDPEYLKEKRDLLNYFSPKPKNSTSKRLKI